MHSHTPKGLARVCAWLITSLLAISSLTAHAQLLCYEGFEYPELKRTLALYPVTNENPEGQPLKYFTEIDTHAVRQPYQYTIRIVDGSVPTKGSAFPFKTKGNSLSWAGEWADVFASIDPNFQFDTNRDNSPLYFSFAIRAKPSSNPIRQISVGFSNGSNHRLQIGVDDSLNTGTPRFFATAANPQPTRNYASSKPFEFDTTYFIVGKIETSAVRADKVSMVVYVPGETVPDSDREARWLVSATEYTDYLVNTVAISIWGGDSGGVVLDELRIGTTWDAVAVSPEPVESVTTAAADTGAGSVTETDIAGSESAKPGEKSSPVVLIMIVLGLVVVIGGGAAYYLFVLKPASEQKPAKPKSAPKPVSAPKKAEQLKSAEGATKPAAPKGPPKPSGAAEPPRPRSAPPKKAPPPPPKN